MLQMYWVRVRTDCIESIFCRWLQWPYKAGPDKGYPVRTLSAGLKKEEEDSIELPIVNPVPTWSFEILGEK